MVAAGVALCFTGCTKQQKLRAGEKRNEAFFFDLKGYFFAEAALLNKRKPQGVKVVLFQGNADTTYLNSISNMNFEKELRSFANSDINRSAWRDKYQVDSVFQNGYLKEIRYTAVDRALKTREVVLGFNRGSLSEVRIKNEIKSVIAKSVQELVYLPERGYAITGNQKIRLGKKYFYDVEVLFSDQ